MAAKRMRWSVMALAAVACAALAGPAAAVRQDGHQTIVDFEEFAPGVHGFHYDDLDTFVSGGVVTDAASYGVPAHSGDNVYVGTSIVSQQTHGDLIFQGVDLWHFMGGWITPGASDVTATFLGYDPDTRDLVVLDQQTTSGQDPNQFLGYDWAGDGPWLIDVRFTSDTPFALDDLLLNHPNSPIAIPEPATWTLALLGFFGVGRALRSRRMSPPAARNEKGRLDRSSRPSSFQA